MAWTKVLPMDLRIHFISDYLHNSLNFSELCASYQISRKTGYKWVARYKDSGVDGLKEQSRRPHSSPYKIPFIVRKELIHLRKKHGWGIKKLLPIIARNHPDWELPARSTAHNILRKEGLVKPGRRRRIVPVMTRPFAIATCPNKVWTADYKGQFKTKDGKYCYPLTVVDAFSRFILACQTVPGTTLKDAKQVFANLFKEFGLPERIRTDNGVPFAAAIAGGLSHLAIWWVRLGIYPERITPGKPQENGRHERMHRTLKAEVTQPPSANRSAQQRRFDSFRDEYNHYRPHEALNFKTPATHYKPSSRIFPKKLASLEYPVYYQSRIVNSNGCIVWRNVYVYIGYVLKGEYVGLNQTSTDRYDVYFGPIRLGYFYEKELKKEKYIKMIKYQEV